MAFLGRICSWLREREAAGVKLLMSLVFSTHGLLLFIECTFFLCGRTSQNMILHTPRRFASPNLRSYCSFNQKWRA
ncbi:hypothetical protein L596_006343 [Steinernema carpocapsae]|uniref:Uncharacterized protein n=1 Tax=Steinernema carpocapsae TaxID=34508 RepID=A0A4U8V1S2_STECR|nr:hypothetical protein L596_006343 [Steinernema carpocapsae]